MGDETRVKQRIPHFPHAVSAMAKSLSPCLSQSRPGRKFSCFLLFFSLCSLSYLFASFQNSKSFTQTPRLSSIPECPPLNLSNSQHPPHSSLPLDFEAHHALSLPPTPPATLPPIGFCPRNFSDYCPCQDLARQWLFGIEKKQHKERHCPPGTSERARCLIPRPKGYKTPFPWPKSKDFAWFANVPYKQLTEMKKSQNWVRLVKDRFEFPGGGTSFPKGVKGYVDEIARVVPLKRGKVRTVLDIGCGVSQNFLAWILAALCWLLEFLIHLDFFDCCLFWAFACILDYLSVIDGLRVTNSRMASSDYEHMVMVGTESQLKATRETLVKKTSGRKVEISEWDSVAVLVW
ncbi:hypothetical protein ACLOJK_011934 [Asimina triloba]